MSRIAVICLGYLGDPAGVVRLARYFAAAGARLYVHIDAAVDVAPYRQALAGIQNAILLRRQNRIYWGGFSLIRTVIDAIGVARADGPCDRICLMTEDSVPLIEASTFRELMSGADEFIKADHIQGGEIEQRYRGFYLFDCAATSPRSEPVAREISPELITAVARLEELRARGKLPIGRLYHGSTYWALTARAVDEILLHWERSPHMRESFEFSMIPEEQYFHTILGNAARRFTFRPFMYADFTQQPRPFVYHAMSELRALRSLPLPFARKAALGSAEATGFVQMLSV